MLITRTLEKQVTQMINGKDVIMLTGPRGIGKTTLLKSLCESSGRKNSSFYVNLENQNTLQYCNESPLNLFKLIPAVNGKKQVVLLDEMQNLNDPAGFVKTLKEKYGEKISFVAASADEGMTDALLSEMNSTVALRLEPLSFYEFVKLREEKLAEKVPRKWPSEIRGKITDSQKADLQRIFWEYAKFGGYPCVVAEEDYGAKQKKLEELVHLFVDLDLRRAGVKNISPFYNLLKILAEKTGEPLNMSELSGLAAITSPTVEAYLKLLSRQGIVVLIQPFTTQKPKELGRMPKCYFCDMGIRNALLNNFSNIEDRLDRDGYFENLCFLLLRQRENIKSLKFWRSQNKQEVDFIINETDALDTRFNGQSFSIHKYKTFQKYYPEISLKRVASVLGTSAENILTL